MFGTPEEMGYDPTVSRVLEPTGSGEVRASYRYTVKNANTGATEVFQTIGKPVSEASASQLISHATRMWNVRRVIYDGDGNEKIGDDGKTVLSEETYILKDLWQEHDAKLETEIQEDIFSHIGYLARDARQYFLPIMHDGLVECGGAADVTPICVHDGHKSRYYRFSRRVARKHVRTVFKEYGKTIYELTDFKSLFQGLLGCLRGQFSRHYTYWAFLMLSSALNYMRMAGYVHRNVGGESLIFCDGVGKLSSLEYTRRYEEIREPEPRIVSPFDPPFLPIT